MASPVVFAEHGPERHLLVHLPRGGEVPVRLHLPHKHEGHRAGEHEGQPDERGTGTTFTIVWAKATIPNGFNADVQIKRPGDASFSNWMLNQVNTMVSESFTPDQGVGTYQFRSRLQNDASGGASNYSKPVSIQVS